MTRPRIDVVAIGISTGGPAALGQIVTDLPADLGVPVVIVQHLPASFTPLLAERLGKLSRSPLVEAVDGALLEPGQLWLAPGSRHLRVRSDGEVVRLVVDDGEPVNGCRPSVDVLLGTVAEVYGGRALAVMMTGMGRDGLWGCARLRSCGGQVLAQDRASSVVWGMPGSVVRAGLADAVVSLDRLAAEITHRVTRASGGAMTLGSLSSHTPVPAPSVSAASFAFVRDLLAHESAIALDERQRYLVEARLAPLARNRGLPSVDALVAAVAATSDQHLRAMVVEALTTNETSFFRDVHAFSALEQTVLPDLVERRAGERRLRIWSAACSTGQEPYSVAMLLADRFPQLASWDVQILATDLSAAVLERARTARYSQQEVNRGLPAARLVRHFSRAGSSWVLRDDVRRVVTFRRLNLAAPWPALPTMDLILLRNVLIYFASAAKQAVLDQTSRVLRRDGWLLLGAAESTMNLTTRFVRVPVERGACYRLQGG